MMWENFTEALYTVFQLKTLLLMFLGTGAGLIAGAIPGFTIAMAVILTPAHNRDVSTLGWNT